MGDGRRQIGGVARGRRLQGSWRGCVAAARRRAPATSACRGVLARRRWRSPRRWHARGRRIERQFALRAYRSTSCILLIAPFWLGRRQQQPGGAGPGRSADPDRGRGGHVHRDDGAPDPRARSTGDRPPVRRAVRRRTVRCGGHGTRAEVIRRTPGIRRSRRCRTSSQRCSPSGCRCSRCASGTRCSRRCSVCGWSTYRSPTIAAEIDFFGERLRVGFYNTFTAS